MEVKTDLVDLSAQDIAALLAAGDVLVGRFATINNDDGFPYIVPVHFVYLDGKIYIHGARKGKKISNIEANSKVGFEVDFMDKVLPHKMPCMANTVYTSIIVTGHAKLLQDTELKQQILNLFVEKYLPPAEYEAMTAKIIDVTSVIAITPEITTAKSRCIMND